MLSLIDYALLIQMEKTAGLGELCRSAGEKREERGDEFPKCHFAPCFLEVRGQREGRGSEDMATAAASTAEQQKRFRCRGENECSGQCQYRDQVEV